MNFLKIFTISSILTLGNCSYIGDRLSKNDESNNPEEPNIVKEKIYIKDDKEDLDVALKDEPTGNFLKGDIENDNANDYPNLADVPERPDKSISIEEQRNIIKKLEEEMTGDLEPAPSVPIKENDIAQIESPTIQDNFIEEEKNYNSNDNYERTLSIREIQNQKLAQIETFKPSAKSPSLQKQEMDPSEKELHDIARSLKDIKTEDEVEKLEEKIQKNDLYYTPKDIENILGFKGLDLAAIDNPKEKEDLKKQEVVKQIEEPKPEIIDTQVAERQVPIARITFPHGSTNLTSKDMNKIREVVEIFLNNKGKKLIVVGHASSRTNYDMDLTKHALTNFNVSLERATQVIGKISSTGLESDKIELVAMSDSQPLYPEIMPSLEAANRRAEIFIQY